MSQILDRVATRPRPRSYNWGGHPSYLARIAFFGVYALRLLSPLQWLKLAYRAYGARSTTHARPDFPAAFSELYFLAVLAAAGAAMVARAEGVKAGSFRSALVAVAALFLLESIVWIVYYLLLRSLVEGKYTIYHPAEYLLTFPVLIATQVFLVALVWNASARTIVAAFTGNPDASSGLLVALSALGLVYLTAALSVLMTSHPGISPRDPETIVVIGAGDVTEDKILPALAELEVPPRDIVVAALGEDARGGTARRIVARTEAELMRKVLAQQSPAIVASPTSAHFRQIVALAATGDRFAVEKPLVASASERDLLRASPELMEKGFALSYYVLEKALPLTYFMQPLPEYRRYLVSDPADFLDGTGFQFIRDSLGALQSLEIRLLEGPDRSPRGIDAHWTERPATLRPFVETCIHPLAVARVLLPGERICWTDVETGVYAPRRDQVGAIAPTFVRATGRAGGATLDVAVGKHIANAVPRRAVAEYRNGRVTADFDRRSLTIEVGGAAVGEICVSPSKPWCRNYAVQMDMVRRFLVNGHGAVRADDLRGQLDALDWWDDLCDRVEEHGVEPKDYDDASTPLTAASSAEMSASSL